MKKIEGLKPFGKFIMTIGQLPASYLVSMTYEEQLIWFCNYLQNTVIPTVNNNGEAVEELQNLFIELKSYVDNYFDNLDLQEKVNNKLDEMAKSGELAEIISQYLALGVLFTFDTASDLADATNLFNGSTAYILGKDTYNDGKGAFYKIRELENTDTPDGDNIITITNTVNLVAEKLPNYFINQINSSIDTINNTTIPAIQSDINTINNTTIPSINTSITNLQNDIDEGITVMIGDSYAEGQSSPSNVNGWCYYLKQLLNIPDNKYYKFSQGGCGFIGYNNQGLTFLNLLQNNDSVITDKTKVKTIILSAGSNDLEFSDVQLSTPINDFISYINTNYPNAKLYVFFQGYTNAQTSTASSERAKLLRTYDIYKKYLVPNKVPIYKGSCYCLRDDNLMSSDHVHPTQAGYQQIAYNMFNILKFGQVISSDMGSYLDNSRDNLVTYSNATWLQTWQLRFRVNYLNDLALITIPGFGICNLTNSINTDSNLQISFGTCTLDKFKPINSIAINATGYVSQGSGTSTVITQCNFIIYIRYDGAITIQLPKEFIGIRAVAILGGQAIIPMDLI